MSFVSLIIPEIQRTRRGRVRRDPAAAPGSGWGRCESQLPRQTRRGRPGGVAAASPDPAARVVHQLRSERSRPVRVSSIAGDSQRTRNRTARGDGAVVSPPWRRADARQRRFGWGPSDPCPSEFGRSAPVTPTRTARGDGANMSPPWRRADARQRRRGCGPSAESGRSPRLGRPEVTSRSCRRLGGALMPGDAGAAAVRETPARPSPGNRSEPDGPR